jgi:hypothetical protein
MEGQFRVRTPQDGLQWILMIERCLGEEEERKRKRRRGNSED